MISLSNLTHHATLFIHPERKNISETLWDELQKNSKAHTFFDNTVLDIDTARSIASWANTPYNERRLALISFHTITIPAQNALLKIVEEPPYGVGFIFITSNKEPLLPTLLSRLNEIIQTEVSSFRLKESDIFLQTKPSERMKLKIVADLLNKVDENGRKDRESIRGFILDIVSSLKENKMSEKYKLECLEIASYASLPSSSTKALLEYLALLLPHAK